MFITDNESYLRDKFALIQFAAGETKELLIVFLLHYCTELVLSLCCVLCWLGAILEW